MRINTTIKNTSVCDGDAVGDAWSVGDGRGWLADTDGLARPVTGDGGRGQPASSRR